MSDEAVRLNMEIPNTIVIVDDSGDAAKMRIYPALWRLYRDYLLPVLTQICSFTPNHKTKRQLRAECAPYMNVPKGTKKRYSAFWTSIYCTNGSFDDLKTYYMLKEQLDSLEENGRANRIFYLALQPSLLKMAPADHIRNFCMAKAGWTRVIVENPYSLNTESSVALNAHLGLLFPENQIYRMDHYLGEEMVQNMFAFRFANELFTTTWNRFNISSVLISLKEPFGAHNHDGVFDQVGIIRDNMQNHLMQILSLVAMEKPTTARTYDIHTEKVKLLRCICPLTLADVVVGQYVGNPQLSGAGTVSYVNETNVGVDSLTPTYALAVLQIENERWSGVPFILRCGKALNEFKTEVRVQYRDVVPDILNGKSKRNELVMRIQPNPSIYMKMMIKSPNVAFDIVETKMNANYAECYNRDYIVKPYEKLILEAMQGSLSNFVQLDEMREVWRIFTPVLDQIKEERIKPKPYEFGTRGPKEADEMCNKRNFKSAHTHD